MGPVRTGVRCVGPVRTGVRCVEEEWGSGGVGHTILYK